MTRRDREPKLCQIEGCDEPRVGRGLCAKHWRRWQRHGDPLVVKRGQKIRQPCRFPGCSKPEDTRGWCLMHYGRWIRHGDPARNLKEEQAARALPTCRVDGCDRPVRARGLCGGHYQRLLAGKPLEPPFRVTRRGTSAAQTCTVEGCQRPVHARGICQLHYQRDWRRELRDLTRRLRAAPAPPGRLLDSAEEP